jgi:hypothetical protein
MDLGCILMGVTTMNTDSHDYSGPMISYIMG